MSKQRGDTIVEVMLAIAVAGAVLGAAYATASHALKTVQQNQERIEALSLAQGQLEALPAALTYAQQHPTSDSPLKNDSAAYCIDTSGNQPQFVLFTGQGTYDEANVHQTPALGKTSQGGGYPDACVSQDLYDIGLQKFDDFYRVYVTWPSVLGDGNDQVTLSYKVVQ